MSYKDEYRAGASEARFWTLKAVLWLLALIVVVYAVLVLLTPLTIGFGWFSGEANIRSFGHVKAVYRDAYDYDNALKATASNACIAKAALVDARKSGDTNAASQRSSQLIAIEQTYNRVKGEYDAAMADHFRAKQVKPADLPSSAPVLSDALKTAGC
jgi:hypothetical protein